MYIDIYIVIYFSARLIRKFEYNRLLILKKKKKQIFKKGKKSADTDADYKVVNNNVLVHCTHMKCTPCRIGACARDCGF